MKKFSGNFLVMDILPLGKALKLNGYEDVTVVALIVDVPTKAHFHYDFLSSYRRLTQDAECNL